MDLVRSKTLVLWNLILIRLINISFLMISTDFKLSLLITKMSIYIKKNPLDLYSSPFVNIYFSLYLIIKKIAKNIRIRNHIKFKFNHEIESRIPIHNQPQKFTFLQLRKTALYKLCYSLNCVHHGTLITG